MIKRTEINSLYILKTIAAFCVVCCHAPLQVGRLELMDLGVPIFFIITGYFLWSPCPHTLADRCLSTIRKTLPILAILTVVYYLIDPLADEALKNPIMWFRWLFVSIPNRYGGPLWYLTAIIWAMVAIFILAKISKKDIMIWGGQYLPLLTLIGCIIGRYRFLFSGEESSYFVLNFVSYALPGLAAGMLLKRHENKLLSSSSLLSLLPISIFCLCLERWIIEMTSEGLAIMGPFIMLYPTAFLVTLFALYLKDVQFSGIITKIGKRYSGNIYYWHMIFVFALDQLSIRYGNGFFYQEFGVIYVFVLSLLFSIFIVWIQDKLNIRIFR